MTPTSIIACLVLFAATAFLFVFVSLTIGRFLRPRNPTREKSQTYECGEPAVGSSYVQFDLRFYVVALVFLIFDVEAAFFFPWAAVYGKAVQLAGLSQAAQTAPAASLPSLQRAAQQKYLEFGLPAQQRPASLATAEGQTELAAQSRKLVLASMADLAVFFLVLLVGFAYVWYRGDLDWVRAVGRELPASTPPAAVNPSDLSLLENR